MKDQIKKILSKRTPFIPPVIDEIAEEILALNQEQKECETCGGDGVVVHVVEERGTPDERIECPDCKDTQQEEQSEDGNQLSAEDMSELAHKILQKHVPNRYPRRNGWHHAMMEFAEEYAKALQKTVREEDL